MEVVFLVLMFLAALTLLKSFGLAQLLIAMLIWMIAGNIAGHIIRGEDYGVAGNIALGLAGGIVGTFLLRLLGYGGIGNIPILGAIVTGIFGAVFFIFIMRLTIDKNFGK